MRRLFAIYYNYAFTFQSLQYVCGVQHSLRLEMNFYLFVCFSSPISMGIQNLKYCCQFVEIFQLHFGEVSVMAGGTKKTKPETLNETPKKGLWKGAFDVPLVRRVCKEIGCTGYATVKPTHSVCSCNVNNLGCGNVRICRLVLVKTLCCRSSSRNGLSGAITS